MMSMTMADVGSWLTENGLGQYVSSFEGKL